MCTCITFCLTIHLSNTTLISPLDFGEREMCACITFYWTRQLFNTTLIGPLAFEGRELCVLVLHFAGPGNYLAHFD